MNELTRKALVDRVVNIITDYDARELSDTELDGLNRDELDCILECLQNGQVAELRGEHIGMNTGLFDKNGQEIKIGDKTRLVLDNGEVRKFNVCFKTVTRTVKNHPAFVDGYSKVAITGIVFEWNDYNLFPCVDENGISDVSKMEIIH